MKHLTGSLSSRAFGAMAAAISICGLLASAPASAELVASRSALGAADFIDWDQLAFNGTFGTSTVQTNLGKSAVVSSGNNQLWRLDQGEAPNGYWQANFTPGDKLVLTWSEVIRLEFADLVAGGGAQFATGVRYGAFDAELSAFDAQGTLLEKHTLPGTLGPGFDGSAVFVGVARSQADIASLEFRVKLVPENFYYGTTINRVDVLQAAAVPEPASVLLLMLGVPLVAWARTRRRKG